ncbi:MAG TPA: S1C family serine protease [Egibacteraceae bacterium]|nr:S1C family serine protease [Egibacteraceae bacterium]
MNVLTQIGEAVVAVAGAAGEAVVGIGRNSRGAGVVVAEGTVVTNAHNLRDRTTQVTFPDGRVAQASVAGLDVDGDLAVLAVDTGGVTPIPWADAPIQLGAPVFALARRGAAGLRTTFGTVSAVDQAFRGPRGRRIQGAFEHTAPLGRGSSGGPVTDAQGRLLGINTSRLDHGFYLAVPADAALRDRVASLSRGEVPQRPRLGVGLAPSSVANRLRRSVGLPEREGLLVRTVAEGGPADLAGVEPGDLIVAAQGRPTPRADDLMDVLDAAPAASVSLTVVRGVDERQVEVTFAPSE